MNHIKKVNEMEEFDKEKWNKDHNYTPSYKITESMFRSFTESQLNSFGIAYHDGSDQYFATWENIKEIAEECGCISMDNIEIIDVWYSSDETITGNTSTLIFFDGKKLVQADWA